MKYLLIILCLFLTSCTKKEIKEDYNYLENNSIRFIRDKENTELLINKDDVFYQIILDKKISNTNYDYQIDLTKTNKININNINIWVDDKINIEFNSRHLCIYKKELDKDNYNKCDFIYLYKIDKDFYITLKDNNTLIYNSYTKFNYKFMYMLARVWIDTYTISTDTYTTITLKEKDYIVEYNKIRGKTIHKRPKK